MKRFIKLPEVIQKTSRCKSSIYELISKGEFPKQVSVGGEKAIAWLEEDVDQWIDDRVAESKVQAA